MNCQRRGTDLTIHIRLALHSLGDDPYKYDNERLSVVNKEAILRALRKRQRDQRILKVGR